jgi:D-sedoheptulose 7-phosphate isomerase
MPQSVMDDKQAAAAVVALFDASIAAHERARASTLAAVIEAAATIQQALAGGGKLLTFGNGGSAADAQHFAAELVGRFQRDRRGFAALALTTDTSTVTSVANDYGFDRIFARQIEALGRPGDVALAISTSGESPNVLNGVEQAKAQGLRTIALTGRGGGPIGRLADVHVNVADESTARIQEVHRTLIHAICQLVEDRAVQG